MQPLRRYLEIPHMLAMQPLRRYLKIPHMLAMQLLRRYLEILHMLVMQPLRHAFGKIGQNAVGASPFEAQQRFHNRRFFR